MSSSLPATLNLKHDGTITEAAQCASPNYDERPENTAIDMIVIHNISLPPGQYGGSAIIDLFHNQLDPDQHPYFAKIYQAKVSAHFLIRRDGSLLQFVPCSKRAWHAGASSWLGRERCNDFSIGIELEGSDFEAFALAQYDTLNQLISALKSAYPIRHIVGHSQIAPGRKTDPGPYFEWHKIGLSI